LSVQNPSGSTVSTFSDLGLPKAVVDVLAANGIETPFPIQAATLPDSLAGRDVLGRGRTGSGKTYAFLLPMVTRLTTSQTKRAAGRPRALILAPTRELVAQIDAALAPLAAATNLRSVTVFGGVSPQPQIQKLRQGVDIVIACPGRLEDHVKSRHADLTNPVEHSVDSAQSPVAAMEHHVLHVDKAARVSVLADLAASPGRKIVFARTKHGAKNLARQLNSRGVPAVELHGNLSQNARTRNLAAFSDGSAWVLVATDIAARGIHVDDVALVVHADPPVEHKAYLHRSGRTARAGADGTVVTLMIDEQVSDVRTLTRKAGVKPTITRFSGASHPVLHEIAPGERTFGHPIVAARPEPTQPHQPRQGQQARRRRSPRGRRPAGATR
jgi:superfamily II DNA/RNA helicase